MVTSIWKHDITLSEKSIPEIVGYGDFRVAPNITSQNPNL
jgi:hypothetical protein